MAMDARLRQILREFRHQAESIFGDRLLKVILFGSRARGDAREDSDIDVLVVLRTPATVDERERVYERLSDLCLREDVVISLTFVREENYQARRAPLLLNVAREGIAF